MTQGRLSSQRGDKAVQMEATKQSKQHSLSATKQHSKRHKGTKQRSNKETKRQRDKVTEENDARQGNDALKNVIWEPM